MSLSVNMVLFLAFILILIEVAFIVYFYRKSRNLTSGLLKKDEELEIERRQMEEFKQSLDKQIEEKIKSVENQVKESEKVDFTLKKALKRSEESNFMKNAFLSNISH
ncbi:MAG: hypothetical protein WCI71_09815, partial [Bacteroidota bacterium]